MAAETANNAADRATDATEEIFPERTESGSRGNGKSGCLRRKNFFFRSGERFAKIEMSHTLRCRRGGCYRRAIFFL